MCVTALTVQVLSRNLSHRVVITIIPNGAPLAKAEIIWSSDFKLFQAIYENPAF